MRLQSSTWLFISAVGFGGLVGCGDDATKPPDAQVIDAAIDAPDKPDVTWDEGGGTTIEWQQIYANLDPMADANGYIYQARATAYYWDSITPIKYPFRVPGCQHTGMATPLDDTDDIFPWGMGSIAAGDTRAKHIYRNVGTVTVSGGATDLVIPPGVLTAGSFADGEFRTQDSTLAHYFINKYAGNTYFDKNDAPYSLAFGGSSEWPAQTFANAFYMPPAYTPLTPAPNTNAMLVAGTDLVQTWTPPPAPVNLPAGDHIAYVTGFIIPPSPGVVAVCFQDVVSSGQLTIPAATVDYIRSLAIAAGGKCTAAAPCKMGRAMLTHRIQEMTDGTTHEHKRQDFVTKYCYVSNFVVP